MEATTAGARGQVTGAGSQVARTGSKRREQEARRREEEEEDRAGSQVERASSGRSRKSGGGGRYEAELIRISLQTTIGSMLYFLCSYHSCHIILLISANYFLNESMYCFHYLIITYDPDQRP